ncbi:ABC-type transport system permease protein 2 [Halorhabdus tiamatea SARL4B]|uniref:ABC-2-type transporter, permease protein n=1 Tax=Halorhabdus tiamatea SARL4B TaxID=1033806 RepID=F7PHN9_9EURY|nr:ABC transporter permease [Halorhabdus tiamatea]ERJ06884.1 ABC-type transport system permease protein 2 [Halorhabdus tiamatea SARL4B]CCQ32412.1 ABC-2-type transporter, permease protein [Halorhabdus tiamatea SARL4B]
MPEHDAEASGSLLDDSRLTIARRDVASLSREKTIVLALVIQLFIAAFSSFLVVGLTSLYDPGSVQAGGIDVGVSGDATAELEEAAAAVDGVELTPYANRAQAMAGFQDRAVQGVLHAETVDGVIEVSATVPQGDIESTIVVVQLRSILEELERTERIDRSEFLDAPPVTLPEGASSSPYFGFTYTVLVPLLLFLPPFISGSIAVDAITEEIERGTLELLRVAPLSLTDIVDGKALGMAVLAPLQAILWIVLLGANGIAIRNVPALVLLVAATSVLVVVFGIVLGLLTGKRQQAQLLYSVLVLGAFGALALLPEHPATVAAKLAVGSATTVTTATVAALAVGAVVGYAAMRRYVGRIDPERY